MDNNYDMEILEELEDGYTDPAGASSTLLPVPSDPREKVPTVYQTPQTPALGSSQDSLQAYLSEIRRFKLLDRAQEDELLKRYYENQDPLAGQILITANLRLVVKIAMEFHSHWLNNLQDLIQEGNIGLLQALKKFDPSRKVKFSYYAAYWIKAYILKSIMDNWRLVKVGTTQAQRKLFFNLKKEQERILKEGLDPGPELLAERLGVSAGEVVEMDSRLASREISLDAPVNPELEESQVNILPSGEEAADNLLSDAQIRTLVAERLARFRKTLDERENAILDRRLMSDEPVTLQEIGGEFGVSRERVRQIETRLKKKISAYLLQELPELNFND